MVSAPRAALWLGLYTTYIDDVCLQPRLGGADLSPRLASQRLLETEMLVIQRNGRTTVITGWRAWLLGAVILVAMTFLMAVIAFVVLGVAITAGAVLLIALPVAIGIAILASLFQPRPR